MQKVVQRTAMAKRQAARKFQKTVEADKAFDRKQARKEMQRQQATHNKTIAAARYYRREDYQLGPLAPRRDVGEWKDKWGTINAQLSSLPNAGPDKENVLIPFGPGDRVVILKGREKGKIGKVREVDQETWGVRVEGMNLFDIHLPEYMREHEGNTSPIRTIERHFHADDVRLVYAIRDPATGKRRDVGLRDVVRKKIGQDIDGEDLFERTVPGTKLRIPYPKLEREPPQDQPADTLRLLSEEQTFVPTLLGPPMPPSVIDELRNKYSYFRDRHDADYVVKKTAEDEAERTKALMARSMITPLKELHARQRAANKAKGRQPLPDGALAIIGEQIAAHKASLKAAKAKAHA